MNGQVHRFDQESFPFDDVTLANPQGLQGGAYISKLKLLGKINVRLYELEEGHSII